jgi:hypothetical protein
METAFESSQLAVFDDVLPTAEFAKLWRYLQFARFRPINPGVEHSPWHVSDGQPLQGETALVPAPPAAITDQGRATGPTHPTEGALECVAEAMLRMVPRVQAWVGTPEGDWAAFSVTPWIYPSGTGLSWHSDGARYSGAYVFYAHPEWDAQWGGELLVADESCRLTYSSHVDLPPWSREERLAYRFDKREMSSHLSRCGMGRMVMAKPNRLVVLAGGNPHKIAKVDPAAGDRVRASISGFFLRPETVRRLAERRTVEAEGAAGWTEGANPRARGTAVGSST